MHKLSVVGKLKISDGVQTFPGWVSSPLPPRWVKSDPIFLRTPRAKLNLEKMKPQRTRLQCGKRKVTARGFHWDPCVLEKVKTAVVLTLSRTVVSRTLCLSPLPWDLIDSLYLLTVQASSGSVGNPKLHRNGIFVSYTGSHTICGNAQVLRIYGFIFKDFTNNGRSQRLVHMITLVCHFYAILVFVTKYLNKFVSTFHCINAFHNYIYI